MYMYIYIYKCIIVLCICIQVYGSTNGSQVKLTVCIEDHKFSPKNFWCVLICVQLPVHSFNFSYRNGRWKSEWSVSFTPGSSAELKGVMRVQVCRQYYNFCLISCFHFTADPNP